MGILRSKLMFIMGMIEGVYIAQNYDVPDIKKLIGANRPAGKTKTDDTSSSIQNVKQ